MTRRGLTAVELMVALVGGIWLTLRLPFAGFVVPGVALGIALLFEGAAFFAIGAGRNGTSASYDGFVRS